MVCPVLILSANLTFLLFACPQLSDAISIIGREDFPKKWPDLLTEMVNRFRSGDFHIINGVLRTAHSLFKRYRPLCNDKMFVVNFTPNLQSYFLLSLFSTLRYRHEFKSNELWSEIKLVLEMFALPLTELFKVCIDVQLIT